MSTFHAPVKVILNARVTLTGEDEGEARERFARGEYLLQYDTVEITHKEITGSVTKQEDA